MTTSTLVWLRSHAPSNFAEFRGQLQRRRGVCLQPGALRLRYREERIAVVGEIVRSRMSKKDAPGFIRSWAEQHVPPEDRARFLEMVETELQSLHEGNFSRHRIRPGEFDAWRADW